jgi:hypothetical protein
MSLLPPGMVGRLDQRGGRRHGARVISRWRLDSRRSLSAPSTAVSVIVDADHALVAPLNQERSIERRSVGVEDGDGSSVHDGVSRASLVRAIRHRLGERRRPSWR